MHYNFIFYSSRDQLTLNWCDVLYVLLPDIALRDPQCLVDEFSNVPPEVPTGGPYRPDPQRSPSQIVVLGEDSTPWELVGRARSLEFGDPRLEGFDLSPVVSHLCALTGNGRTVVGDPGGVAVNLLGQSPKAGVERLDDVLRVLSK